MIFMEQYWKNILTYLPHVAHNQQNFGVETGIHKFYLLRLVLYYKIK
jgi:hypothetical protein